MPNLLAIDTSTDACSVALLCGEDLKQKFSIANRQHVQLILPYIDALLAEAQIELRQLDAIAFTQGPGSFTGVRIGASVTQGLAFAVDLPCIAISTLQALAQTAYEETQAQAILVCLNAHMQEVYWGTYRLGNNAIMQAVLPDQLCKPDLITIDTKIDWLGIGDGWKVYAEQLAYLQISKLKTDIYPQPSAIMSLAKDHYANNRLIKAEEVTPVYLRSENAWKKLT